MSSSSPLAAYISRFVQLTQDETDIFCAAFKQKKIRKKQMITQPDFVERFRNFVLQGAFRSYQLTEDGKEHTLQFAIENWWICDFNSYLYQQPATLFIAALEDSVVLQLEFEKEQILKKSNSNYERIFRIMAEKGLAFEHRRIMAMQTLSAEERYQFFLDHFPHFVQRVPQYALASYLGMTTEFLSRIRHQKTVAKN